MTEKPTLKFLLILTGMVAVGSFAFLPPAWSAEKLRVGMAVRVATHYYLPGYAAQEAGYWKEAGLEVELVPFSAGGHSYRAAAAGAIDLNMSSAPSFFHAVAGKVPVALVADLYWLPEFTIWVRADSPIKEPRGLKGAKIGVAAFGGSQHTYAQAVTRSIGLEKEVRFVATGGIRENLAALKTGAVDALCLTPYQLIMLKLKGEVRELVKVADYLPQEWSEHIIDGRTAFIRARPEATKQTVKAVVRATDFIRQNRRWVLDKMKATHGYSEEAAAHMYDQYVVRGFTRDGVVRVKALENVRTFLIDYGVLSADKVPPVEAAIWEGALR